MVTFICENCDQTLKKNQLDRHLFQCRAPPRFVCIDCNKIFLGCDYKYHTSCISEQEKTMGQYYKPKKQPQSTQMNQTSTASIPSIQKENGIKKESEPIKEITKEKWFGWKKSIRKTLQKQPNFEMNIAKLKAIIMKEYLKNKAGVDEDAEKIFQEKIQNSRFKIKKKVVKYIPKKIRTAATV